MVVVRNLWSSLAVLPVGVTVGLRRVAGGPGVRADFGLGSAHVAQGPLRNPGVNNHAAIGVAFREDFAVARQHGQQPPVVDARLDVDVQEAVAERLADGIGQGIDSLTRVGADRKCARIATERLW